jgi:hypothetical protein
VEEVSHLLLCGDIWQKMQEREEEKGAPNLFFDRGKKRLPMGALAMCFVGGYSISFFVILQGSPCDKRMLLCSFVVSPEGGRNMMEMVFWGASESWEDRGLFKGGEGKCDVCFSNDCFLWLDALYKCFGYFDVVWSSSCCW